ncbi:universal stress protein [Halosimplex halophilum]|uniref:universal stress protein n=1 Tax=Halosimplex halophilum TaxID=2559572 RepID=UPI00107F631D|nr:universal stress protein [Halosimplex halophilum]
MPIESVLLPVGLDDSDRADRLVAEAVAVAGPTGATVSVLHVFTESGLDNAIDRLDFDRDGEGVTPEAVARRLAYVQEVTSQLDDAGVDYEVLGAVGDAAERITEVAEEIDADRILIGGRKRSPTGKAVFGSTAQSVMLDASCPVTFVRSDDR